MPTSPNKNSGVIHQLDAHHRLIIAFTVATVTSFIFYGRIGTAELILVTWICFAMSLIIPQWIVILTANPQQVISGAKLQDSSRYFIFLFVIGAAIVSLGAIIALLKLPKQPGGGHNITPMLLSLGTVLTSWWLIHTVFTLTYAHQYYDLRTDSGKAKPGGGLKFPDDDEPDYLDFVYYSFTIGMTFQVSDVDISTKKLRRLTLLHGLISFLFNTAIVALSINVVSSLVSSN